MEYYENYMDDAVVRVDGSRRFVKCIENRGGQEEVEITNPKNKTAFGGEGFGVFYSLDPITKEEYDTFGSKWWWDPYTGKKVVAND